MKQFLSYVIVVLLWIFVIVLAFLGRPIWVLVLLGLHIFEYLFIGFKIGNKINLPFVKNLIMTLVFGIIWWKPFLNRSKN